MQLGGKKVFRKNPTASKKPGHGIADVPSNVKPIDSRLVLATKIDLSGGNDHKLKTRLCAKGFTQRHGIDYFETLSPVGHRQPFRLLLFITASLDLELKGLDITTAFLHGP